MTKKAKKNTKNYKLVVTCIDMVTMKMNTKKANSLCKKILILKKFIIYSRI